MFFRRMPGFRRELKSFKEIFFMFRYKVLSHTADLRLQVFGGGYEELLKNAVLGLGNILSKGVEKKMKLTRGFEKVEVEASDREVLLVNFLNEVIALSSINKKVYPKVKVLRISPFVVEAQVFGVPVEKFDKDVKAISYHNAYISKTDKGILKVTLTLDI